MEPTSEPIEPRRSSLTNPGRSRRIALFLGVSASLGLTEPLLAIFLPQEVDNLGDPL